MAYTHDEHGNRYYTASTREDMTRHIEELLGSEGSPELAAAMFPLLSDDGYIGFDGREFVMTSVPDDDDTWTSMLALAEENIAPQKP